MCGIVGVIGYKESKKLMELGLRSVQHRGQASWGVAFNENGKVVAATDMGLVGSLPEIPSGQAAIGHVRYATSGKSEKKNAQPFVLDNKLAIVHNGDLIDIEPTKQELKKEGVKFETTSDTEVIIHLIAKSQEHDIVQALIKVLQPQRLRGAFSLLFLWQGNLIAARDPWGFRPLVLGRSDNGYAFASETCAFDHMGIEYVRDVEPGEIIVISPDLEIRQFRLQKVNRLAHCIFELVYFARPDSIVFGYHVGSVRYKFGKTLGKELRETDDFSKIDVLIPILDSGRTATLGLAQIILQERVKNLIREKSLQIPEDLFPMDYGVNRNQYSIRTFIRAGQQKREDEVKVKHNVDRVIVRGKRVYFCDDTIVRATTVERHARNFRDRGATEVHARIAAPPITHPCFYGIEMKERKTLAAATHTIEEIALTAGLNSLVYLSQKGFKSCIENPQDFCFACFDGHYPVLPR